MQKLQRKAGLLLPRTADDAQVGLLLKDFDEGDKMFKVIIEATKQFRIAWTDILQTASGMATDFEELYQFIPGDPENNARYRPTNRDQLAKVSAFKEALGQVRNTMIQELGEVEKRVSGPAKDARKHIDIYQKVIKTREDKKLDWERYQSRTDALEKKGHLSERDQTALTKHRYNLEASEKAYTAADAHLKETLPGLTQAIYDLLPRLVNAQSMIQNTMLGHYYTALHDYCQEYGYPIPSSEWRQVQTEFEDSFPRPKNRVESISMIQQGRAVKSPFHSRPDNLQTRTISHKDGFQPMRSNGSLPPPVPSSSMPAPTIDLLSKPSRTLSNQSYSRPSPPPSTVSFKASSDYLNRPTVEGANRHSSYSQKPPLSPSIGSIGSAAAAVASKKKPPPPPPPKKKPSVIQDYVIAQYDFPGDGEGDLAFREGDKIRVIKRTESTNDWWEGECRGVRGSFPANYCKAI